VRRAIAVAAAAGPLLSPILAQRAAGATFTYTGPGGTAAAPTTGNWNAAGNWVGGLPASNAATELVFGGSGGTAYTATNDVGAFTLNLLTLNSTATVAESISSATVLSFATNGTVTPVVQQNGTGAITVAAPVTATTLLTFAQAPVDPFGAATFTPGTVTLTGAVVNTGGLTFAGGVEALSGAISGAGALIVGNAGSTVPTVTLSGGSTMTGATALNAGSLTLDFTTNNTNKISTAALTLGGGVLSLNGNAAAASSQTVASTALTGGARVVSNPGSGQTATLNLGAITRSTGATLDFSSTGSFTTTTVNGATSILGGWATFGGGSTWAVTSGTAGTIPVTGLATYTAGYATAAANVDATATGTLTAGAAYNSLRFNTAAAVTVTGNGANTITSGGILVTPTVGANATTITGGTTLTTGNAADLIVNQYNTAGTLTIASVISGTTGLTKAGPGRLIASGANTFTGNVNVTGGVLQVNAQGTGNTSTGGFGVATSTTASKLVNVSNGGTIAFNFTYNVNNLTQVFVIGNGGGTFDVGSGFQLTIDDGAGTGVASGASELQGSGDLTKTGVGILSLGTGGSNFAVYTGRLFLNAGTTQIGTLTTGSNPLGAATAGTYIAGGAVLNLAGINVGAEPIFVNGTGLASAPAGALVSTTGTGTAGGLVTLLGASSVGGAGNINLTGGLAGGGNTLTKVGAGNLTLSGASAYTAGPVNLSAGTLTVGAGSTVNTGTITLNAGTLASVPGAAGVVTNAVLAGSAAHAVAPGGNAAIGGLTIGSLTTSSNTTLTFDFGAPGATPNTVATANDLLTISGTDAFVIGANTKVAFNVAPAVAGMYRLIGYTSGGVLDLTNLQLPAAPNGRTTYAYNTAADPGFVDLQVTTGATIATNWIGTGAGPNSWNTTGNWDNGVPGIGGDVVTFGTSAGTTNQSVTLDGQQHVGSLTFNNTAATTTGLYTLSAGTGTGSGLFLDTGTALTGTATLTNAAANNTITAPVTLVSNSTIAAAAGTILTLSGGITNAGLGTLTIPATHAGTLTLPAASTYANGTTIQAGTVLLGNAASLGTGTIAITPAGGAAAPVVLQATGAAVTATNPLTVSGDFTFGGTAATNNLTLSGATALTVTPTVNVANAAVTGTLSGVIAGAFGFTKTGPGTLAITNTNTTFPNTFTGPIVVDGGTLSIPGQTLGAANLKTVTLNNNSTLLVTTTYDVVAGTYAFVVGPTGGTINVASGQTFTANDASQFGGTTGTFTKAGAGTMILANQTYAFNGAMNVAAGTLQLLTTASLGTPTGLTVGSGGAFDLRTTSPVPITLNGPGVTAGSVGALTAGAATGTTTGTITLATASAIGGAGNLVLANTVSGTGPLTKVGAGLLTLSVANNYTGNTVVSAGTLVAANGLTGSATGAGNVTLDAGVLASAAGPVTAATGTVAGTVLAGLATHTVAPGGVGTIGALSVGGLTASGVTANRTTLNFDLNGPGTTGDLLTVGGVNALTVAGGTALVSFGANPSAAGAYRLIGYAGSIADPNSLFTLPASPNARITYVLDTVDDGFIDLVVTNAGGNTTATYVGTTTPGSYDVGTNWSGGVVPGVAGDTAIFASSIAATNTVVNLNSQQRVGSLSFTNSSTGTYTLATGTAGTLFLDNGTSVATVTNSTNANVISAPVVLASDSTVSAAAATSLTFSGVVSGVRSLTVGSANAGTILLTAANTYSGGTTVNAGTVSLGTATSFGTGPVTVTPTAAVTLLGSAALTLANPVNLNGDVTFGGTAATNNLTFGGPVALGASPTVTVSNAAVTTTMNGVVSGAFGLTKAGPGALTLTGANTYTGDTTVAAGGGVLTASTATVFAAGNQVVVGNPFSNGNLSLNGGTVQLKANGQNDVSGQVLTYGNNVAVAGTNTIDVNRQGGTGTAKLLAVGNLSVAGGSQLNVTGANAYGLLVAAATTINGAATFNPTTAGVRLAGPVTSSGNALSVIGSNVLTLANTSTAAPNAISGTMTIGTGASVQSFATVTGTGSNPLDQAAVALTGGTLRVGTVFGGTPLAGANGFNAQYYSLPATPTLTTQVNFQAPPTASRVDPVINAPNNATGFTPGAGMAALQPNVTSSNLGVLWTGLLNVTTAGAYAFQTSSDDGSTLFVDGIQVVANDGGHGIVAVTGGLPLTAGQHLIQTKYFNGTGGAGNVVSYQGPDTANALVLIGSTAGQITTYATPLSATLPNALTVAAGTTTSTLDVAVDTTVPTFAFTGTGATTFNVTGGGVANATVTTASVVMPGNLTLSPTSAGLTFTGALSESSAGLTLTKVGAAPLELSGTNTYTGATTISAGTLRANDGVGLPAASLLTINGGVFETGANFARTAGTAAGNVQFLAAADGLSARGGPVVVSLGGLGTPTSLVYGTAPFAMTSLVLNDSTATSTLTFANPIDLANVARTFTVNATAPGTTATISGALTSVTGGTAGGITKTGLGTLALSSTGNTYAGTTAINTGTLAVGATNGLSPNSVVQIGTTTTAATLDASAFSATAPGLTVLGDSAALTQTLVIGAGQILTLTGNVTIGSASAALTQTNLATSGGGTLRVNNASTTGVFNVGGTTTAASVGSRTVADLTGLGTLDVILSTGGGVFRVNPQNTNLVPGRYSTLLLPAVTNITATTLAIGDSAQLNGAGTGQVNAVSMGGGATTLRLTNLNIGTGARDVGSLTFAGAAGTLSLQTATAGRTAFNLGTGGAVTGASGADGNTFDVSSHTANLLLGAVAIGTQTARISPLVNTFSFDKGTLDLTSLTMSTKAAAGTSTTTSTLNLGSAASTAADLVTIGTATTGGILQMGQNASTTAGTTTTATINIAGGTVNIGATSGTSITMAAASTATATALATLNLTGGATTVSGNIVKTGGAGTSTASLILNGGALDMTGKTIGSATAGQSVVGTFAAGVLSNLGGFNGATGTLTKSTAGTLTITGTNTYAATTVVTAGTLLVNGSVVSNTSVTAGTVGGSGTISGTLTLAGGTLAPGNSPGNLSTGSLTLQAPATLSAEIAGPVAGPGNSTQYDQVTVTGGVSLAGSLQVALLGGYAPDDQKPFYLILNDGTDAVSGTFAGIAEGQQVSFGGTNFLVSYAANGDGGSVGNDVALIAQVPEPAAASLAAVAAIGLLARRRRARRA
jgi:fibronectin-binding autotransporter adhesin